MEADYLRFESQGKGDIRKAKDYYNVVSRGFFDIPVNQVSLYTAPGITRNITHLTVFRCPHLVCI
jgi:hypothetical protein